MAIGGLVVVACRTTEDARPPASPAVIDASAPVVAVVIDAGDEEAATLAAATPTVVDSGADAAAGVACIMHGKPCTPHCAELAAKYLAMPPDGSGRCDPKTCASVGGLCDYGGFCFGQTCIKKTHDGGRACTDGSQCESGCEAPTGAPRGPGRGKCFPITLRLGCHSWVVNGTVGLGICGD